MRQTALVVSLVAVTALAACGKKSVPPPPSQPVVAPQPPVAPPPTSDLAPPQVDEYERLRQMSADEIERMGLLADIHFDYDKADLREGDRQILSRNADALKKYDFLKITIEGHCDERGSAEYNLALGERRAKAANDYLVSLGVPAARLKTVSYGKEVPLCQESTEDCWARNRRDHFGVTGKTK